MMLIHTIRVRHAERLLSLGELSLDEVAWRVGYVNITSLCPTRSCRVDFDSEAVKKGLHK